MNLDTGVFDLTQLELRALLGYASQDRTRLNLSGVAFDVARSRVFATDGHRVAVAQLAVPYVGPSLDPTLVPCNALEWSLRIVPKRGALRVRLPGVPIVAPIDGPPALGLPSDMVCLEVIDEAGVSRASSTVRIDPAVKAPPIDQVIPRVGHLPTAAVAFNARYLADLLPICKAAETQNVRLFPPGGELDPMLCKVCSPALGIEWTIVIMPVKSGLLSPSLDVEAALHQVADAVAGNGATRFRVHSALREACGLSDSVACETEAPSEPTNVVQLPERRGGRTKRAR